jgi:hypothetical protein
MISLRPDEWRDVLLYARDIKDGPLGTALKMEIQARYEGTSGDLESIKTPIERVRYAQGERYAHKRDIMILEDLIRQGESALKRLRRANDEDED